jgi:hypothetical protein
MVVALISFSALGFDSASLCLVGVPRPGAPACLPFIVVGRPGSWLPACVALGSTYILYSSVWPVPGHVHMHVGLSVDGRTIYNKK